MSFSLQPYKLKTPQMRLYSDAGVFTYLRPKNLAYLIVEVVGGGGGGASNSTTPASDGGESSFEDIVVAGGGYGALGYYTGTIAGFTTGGAGGGGDYMVGDFCIYGQNGEKGFAVPRYGASAGVVDVFGVGGAGGKSFFSPPTGYNFNTLGGADGISGSIFGCGGSGAKALSGGAHGGGGGAYCKSIIPYANIPESVTITVGAGGAGAPGGTQAGGEGANGCVLLTEFYR